MNIVIYIYTKGRVVEHQERITTNFFTMQQKHNSLLEYCKMKKGKKLRAERNLRFVSYVDSMPNLIKLILDKHRAPRHYNLTSIKVSFEV